MSDGERRRLVIQAAETVFLSQGYGASGMSDIAQHAGMSKKTLYGLFDSKESLFAAVIAARRETVEPALAAGSACDVPDIVQILCRYLASFVRFVIAPRQIALYRLVIAEAHRAPDLSRAFYREGPEKARAPLAGWLKSLHAEDRLQIPDPDRAAAVLIAMAVADLHMQVMMMGDGASITDDAINRSVAEAVRIFLRGTAASCAEDK